MGAFRAESRLRVGGAQAVADEDSQSDEAQEQFETTEWLGRALLKLPFKQRTALELMYYADGGLLRADVPREVTGG